MRVLSQTLLSNDEVAKQVDFQGIADLSYENAATFVAALCGENLTTAMVVRGLQVLPATGMNLTLKAGMAVNLFGQTFVLSADVQVSIAPNTSGQTRIDTIVISETTIQGLQENRAFKDPIGGTVTVQPTNTQETWTLAVNVIEGTPGASSAPATTVGWVKVAEVTVPNGASSFVTGNIAGVTMTNPLGIPVGYGDTNTGWTNEASLTCRIGDLFALKSIFRALVDETGTPYPGIISKQALAIGTGSTQIKAQDLPVGTPLSLRGLTALAGDALMTELQNTFNLLAPEDDIKQILINMIGPGIFSGLGFSLSTTNASVASGFGISPLGDIVRIQAGVGYTLSGFSRPSAGNSVWVMFCLQPNPAIIGATYSGPDWFTLVPVSGTPAASPTKPALSATNGLLVAEVLVDNSTTWTSLTVDYSRVVLSNGGSVSSTGTDTLVAVKAWNKSGHCTFGVGTVNTPEGTATANWFYVFLGDDQNGSLLALGAAGVTWTNWLIDSVWQGWVAPLGGVTLDTTMATNDNLHVPSTEAIRQYSQPNLGVSLDNDGALGANSPNRVVGQSAIRTYVGQTLLYTSSVAATPGEWLRIAKCASGPPASNIVLVHFYLPGVGDFSFSLLVSKSHIVQLESNLSILVALTSDSSGNYYLDVQMPSGTTSIGSSDIRIIPATVNATWQFVTQFAVEASLPGSTSIFELTLASGGPNASFLSGATLDTTLATNDGAHVPTTAAVWSAFGPIPTTATALGSWQEIWLSGTYSDLPAGGTWAYWGANSGSGFAGVAAGGTTIWSGSANNFFGFCWRVK